MDNSGRQPRKTKRLADRPFYEKTGLTSAEIVSEARSSVRSLNTKRPCTPTESKRTLFNTALPRPTEGRPPSALSNKVQYEESSSRPPSGRARLTPLESTPDIPEETILPGTPSVSGVKPRRPIPSSGEKSPAKPVLSPSGRPNLKHKSSVLGSEATLGYSPLPPPLGSPNAAAHIGIIRRNSAGPTPSPPSAIKSDILGTRRVRSGPKERISPRSSDNDGHSSKTHDLNIDKPKNNDKLVDQNNERTINKSDEKLSSESASNSSSMEDISCKKPSQARSNSGDKRKRKVTENEKQKDEMTIYHEKTVKPLLSRMEERFSCGNLSDLASDCLLLWNVLDKKGMLGKASGSSSAKRRGEVLKTLFKFLDVNDSRLLLRLGKLILSMKVTGNNITNICMVIYKLAKTETNDRIFSEENMLKHLVDALKMYDILTYRDALIYITGALKHLTNTNPLIQQELFSLETIQSLGIILETVCSDIHQYSRPEKRISNLLIQVTGVLRYLADLTGARDLYLEHNIIKYLGDILNYFSIDEDLVYNISRILSKLTLYNDCCTQLQTSETCFKALLKSLKDYERKQEITVRLCFILGNLTAKNNQARIDLFNEPSCLATLLSVSSLYFDLDQNARSESSDSSRSHSDTSVSSSSSGYNSGVNNNNNNNNVINNNNVPVLSDNGFEDVLVKTIRVIANLSINPDVGSSIAADVVCINVLLQILDVKSVERSEELVLNTVATLNNLSYYHGNNSAVSQRHLDITESLLCLLLPENMDAMVEASRVFGNLTRDKQVRNLLADKKVDEIMIALLDAGERETVYTACGVLINLMVDSDIRPKLKHEGGIKKLIDVLHDFGKNDWQLSAMVCQILWNYSGDITTSAETFGEEESIELIDVLTIFLDEEAMFETSSMENMDSHLIDTLRDMWESTFCPVGETLLRRISSHHSDLVPLETPS